MENKYIKALQVFEDNKELFDGLDIRGIRETKESIEKIIFVQELKEKYGFENVSANRVKSPPPNIYMEVTQGAYYRASIMAMGEKYNRTISWPRDGKQPIDEIMYNICFPCGALMFGDEYPTEFFDEMWEEIKTYDYKYVDNHNHSIYFYLEKAAPIANGLTGLVKKYYDRWQAESDKRRAQKLRKELARLEGKGHE